MSSVGESAHTDRASDEPMMQLGMSAEEKSSTYTRKMKQYARKGQCKWIVFITLIVLVLIFLLSGAVFMLIRSTQEVIVTPKPPEEQELEKPLSQKQIQQENPQEFKFELRIGENRREEGIINLKENYTEIFTEEMTVFNYFRKRISLHRLEVSPGVQICLVKVLTNEVKPGELKHALTKMASVEVNSTELYIVDSTPVPDDVTNDMTVHQFCDKSDIYSIKIADENGPDVGLTMEQIIENFHNKSGRYRREARDSMQGTGGLRNCGRTVDTPEGLPTMKYTCTKKREYCYRSLVNEQCEDCYHGNSIRTRGCWCPIKAIEACIKITYKPDERYCCGVDSPPCIRAECETKRVPYIPIPEISFKIVTGRTPTRDTSTEI